MEGDSLESAVRKYCEGQFALAEQLSSQKIAERIHYQTWLNLTNTLMVGCSDMYKKRNLGLAVQSVYEKEYASKFKELRLHLGEDPDAIFWGLP
jgi:hypothetical protein